MFGDDATTGSGSTKSRLNKFEKADGPGSIAIDEKLERKKYEAEPGDNSSTQNLLLPLRDALHELASLKILNPEMAADTLVQRNLPPNDIYTTHAIKPGKRENKKRKKEKSTRILKAGGASIASQQSTVDSDINEGDIGEDDVHSTLDDEAEEFFDPMLEPLDGPRAKQPGGTGAPASSHAFIKERGRVFEFKSIKDRKKKVVTRLLPPEFPGSPLAAGGGRESPPVGSPTMPISSSPAGFAPSQRIDRSDKGPDPILPWRDEVEKKAIDVEHMVAPTGVYFVTPKSDSVPAPRRPRNYVKKVVSRYAPAGHVEQEQNDMPKHPLFN